ncbi:hypothetical protein [Sinobaca sp. H24]|uniref:hypothetical protein n=1 Tax=Sinobaca sp. H24 TaxID=2923376 RepID=UPI0020793219|nr:hypothetical protein [Sinobaca sp. H24]
MKFQEEYPQIYKECSEAKSTKEVLQILRNHSDQIEDKYGFGFQSKKDKNHDKNDYASGYAVFLCEH